VEYVGMKSTVHLHRPPLKEYPRLRVGKNGAVVLFCNPFTGMVVGGDDSGNPVGIWSEDWLSDQFTDFHGSVTLENE
jgi:hypothetical protein